MNGMATEGVALAATRVPRERATALPKFFTGLESLRGVAALMVALYHISWQTHVVHWQLVRNDYLMVDFFFLLSGFVIFHSYGERLRTFVQTKRFLLLRLGRLYPLHLATLLFFVAVEGAKWTALRLHLLPIASAPFSVNKPVSLISNVLLIHALGVHKDATWNVPSWSISTEFYTYVLCAIVCMAFSSRLVLLAVSSALAAAGLAVSWFKAGGLVDTAQYAFFRCVFGFFCGVIAWHVYRALARRGLNARAIVWIEAGLFVTTIWFLMEKMPGHSDFLATPLFAAIIITVALGQGWLSRVLDTAPLVSLGRVSYSIYLVHPVVIWLFETFLQYGLKLRRAGFYPVALGAGDALTAAYLIAVVLVSGWTFTHIEDRFRRRTRAWVEG
jgi:hypothetical protein